MRESPQRRREPARQFFVFSAVGPSFSSMLGSGHPKTHGHTAIPLYTQSHSPCTRRLQNSAIRPAHRGPPNHTYIFTILCANFSALVCAFLRSPLAAFCSGVRHISRSVRVHRAPASCRRCELVNSPAARRSRRPLSIYYVRTSRPTPPSPALPTAPSAARSRPAAH